jgi:hypothetical protein
VTGSPHTRTCSLFFSYQCRPHGVPLNIREIHILPRRSHHSMCWLDSITDAVVHRLLTGTISHSGCAQTTIDQECQLESEIFNFLVKPCGIWLSDTSPTAIRVSSEMWALFPVRGDTTTSSSPEEGRLFKNVQAEVLPLHRNRCLQSITDVTVRIKLQTKQTRGFWLGSLQQHPPPQLSLPLYIYIYICT